MRNWCLQCIECSRTVCYSGFRFDVTDGFSRYIAKEYDRSLIDSDSMGPEGVIQCNIVTYVVRMCLRR